MPRLWVVSGKTANGTSAAFHILGVSHDGFDIEYDEYFEKKVLPIFRAANVYSREAALIASSNMPACPRPLEDTKENHANLHAARERIRTLAIARGEIQLKQLGFSGEAAKNLIESSINQRVAKLTEFGLVTAMQEEAITAMQTREATLFSRVWQFISPTKPQISNHLYSIRKSGMRVESIDLPSDVYEAYCSLEMRSKIFQLFITEFDSGVEKKLDSDKKARNELIFINYLKENKMEYSPNFPGYQFHMGYICERNRKWARRMMNDFGNGERFYALGFAHLLPLPRGGAQCEDLFTLLRNAGMSVTPYK